MAGLEVREYRDEDRDAVRRLLVETYGTAAVFDRIVVRNPLGQSLRAVVELRKRIVGYNCWTPWVLHTRKGVLVGYQSNGSAVDREVRGKGLFGLLLAKGDELAKNYGASFLFGFPNPASFGSFIKNGYVHIGNMPLRVLLSPSTGQIMNRRNLAETDFESFSENSNLKCFVHWRYAAANVPKYTFSNGSKTLIEVYYRQIIWRRIRIVKVLDILVNGEKRDFTLIRSLGRRLPGPAIVVFRFTLIGIPCPRLGVLLPKSWQTPIICKDIRPGCGAVESLRRQGCFVYGDIDAS